MPALNRQFVLIADNGDRLYPYIKTRRSDGEVGYVVGPPGLGDKNGNGEYYKDIETVLQKVLFDGYSVRAQTDRDETNGRQRAGGFKVGAQNVHKYELDMKLHHVVVGAEFQPNTNEKTYTIGSGDSILADEYLEFKGIQDKQVIASIKSRRGQPKFRSALLKKYRNTCCISGTGVVPLLEAAHIVPHSEVTDYSVDNGLLLRSDIHTLFDCNLMKISFDGKVGIDEVLLGTEYAIYSGRKICKNISEEMKDNFRKREYIFKQTKS